MSGFIKVLKDSFELLSREPKLFIPKLIVAGLFSIPLLAFPELAFETLALNKVTPGSNAIAPLTNALWAIGAFIIASSLIDVLVNAMYPFMVNDYFEKKPISISGAFRKSMGKFFVTAPAVLAIELLTIVIAILASIPLALAVLSGNYAIVALVIAATLLLFFIIFVLFYFVYPLATLEKSHFIGALRQSVSLSMKNKGDISKATALTFVISLLAFFLAFAVNFYSKTGFVEGSIIALLLFIGIRFATAMLYTYQYVLNPVLYLEYEKNKVMK